MNIFIMILLWIRKLYCDDSTLKGEGREKLEVIIIPLPIEDFVDPLLTKCFRNSKI